MTAVSRPSLLWPLLAVAAGAGLWFLTPAGPRDAALRDGWSWLRGEQAAEGTYWCPMDPEIVRTGKGTCPICSMELVPFEGARTDSHALSLSDRQVQQAGVRLGDVGLRRLVRAIDATGRIEVDPTLRRKITMRFPGKSRIVHLYTHSVGDTVQEGGVLLEVSNANLVQSLRALQDALARFPEVRSRGDARATEEGVEHIDRARERLTRYGLSPGFVSILASKPKHLYTEPLFPVVAAESGTVLVDPDLEVDDVLQAGQQLYAVADLSQLWLEVDLFEDDLPFARIGQVVEFTTRAVPDEVFRTTLRAIEPLVRSPSRTVHARARVGSLDGKLLPGMFVRATISCDLGDVLAVPESAVLQSGRRDVVIVSEGEGRFRPRLVHLGRRHLSAAVAAEDRGFAAGQERFHEVLSGLAPGDRVVVAGNFLLNAEAQFQGILQKMASAAEAEERAPALPQATTDRVNLILDQYLALAATLVGDDDAAARTAALGLLSRARSLQQAEGPLSAAGERMAAACEQLAAAIARDEPDWDGARTAFGALSRELVDYLDTWAPGRVSSGELHLFRCPMAGPFGFDLWVQREPEVHNPYMGQRMPACGEPADLP